MNKLEQKKILQQILEAKLTGKHPHLIQKLQQKLDRQPVK